MGVFEIGHIGGCTRIERVDDHFALHWAGDFNPTVLEVGRYRAYFPVAVSDLFCLREEVGQLPIVDLALPIFAFGQQFDAPVIESPVEVGDKAQGVFGQDCVELGLNGTCYFNIIKCSVDAHGWPPERE